MNDAAFGLLLFYMIEIVVFLLFVGLITVICDANDHVVFGTFFVAFAIMVAVMIMAISWKSIDTSKLKFQSSITNAESFTFTVDKLKLKR
jgi:heme A synthase